MLTSSSFQAATMEQAASSKSLPCLVGYSGGATKANNFVLSHFASHLWWALKRNTQQYMKLFLEKLFCFSRKRFQFFSFSIPVLLRSSSANFFNATFAFLYFSDCLCLRGYIYWVFKFLFIFLLWNWIKCLPCCIFIVVCCFRIKSNFFFTVTGKYIRICSPSLSCWS